MKRHFYSKEFKKQAVNLIIVEGQLIRFVARTLEIHENTLYRWIVEYVKFGNQAFPGNRSNEFVSQSKIKKLEK